MKKQKKRNKIDLCINDLDLLRKRESDYYKGIALLKADEFYKLMDGVIKK